MKYFCTLIMAMCAICLAQEKAPVLLWDIPLNEGDFSQFRNLGTQSKAIPKAASTALLQWGEGRLEGKALYFKNSPEGKRPVSSLAIPAAFSYDFSKPFTIACWFMIDPTSKDVNQYTILGNVVSDYGPGFRILYGWGTMRTAFGDGSSKSNGGLTIPPSRISTPLGAWNHVALTYDGKTARYYFNGLLAIEKATTIHPTTPALRPFSIGSYNSSAYGFVGAISNIKLYDQPLSPLDILKLVKEL